MGDPIDVQHEDEGSTGSFFYEKDGKRLAEMTYLRSSDTVADIEHTRVDDSLRGQGVARKLLDAAVAWARAMPGLKLTAHCAYAKSQFEKDPRLHDVIG